MQHFKSGQVDIAYLDEGEGEPIVLIHGFASNVQVNWVGTGWVKVLTEAGRRVIAYDNRGHGQSGKLYESAGYESQNMAEDARALLDHLEVERADILGYSMGARITAFLALNHPARVRGAIIGGLGYNLVLGMGDSSHIADALDADDPAGITDPNGIRFRRFAEQTGSDLKALAACMRSGRKQITPEELRQIALPVLIAVGTRDDVAGSAADLAALIPGAKVLDIPDKDHMSAVGDKVFKAGVLEFLAGRP